MLHTTPLRESDLIVSVLTQDWGKVSAVARGARRSKKRFMGGVSGLDAGIFEFEGIAKNNSLYSLSGISQREVWLGLRNDFFKLSFASHCLEVTNLFSPEGDFDSGKLLPPLLATLTNIDKGTDKREGVREILRWNLAVLKFSGINPMVDLTIGSPVLQHCYEQLLEAKKVPPEQEITDHLLYEGMLFLLEFIDRHLHRPLRTRQHLLQVVAQVFRSENLFEDPNILISSELMAD